MSCLRVALDEPKKGGFGRRLGVVGERTRAEGLRGEA